MSRAHERQRRYQITATAAIPHDHAACPQFLDRFRNFFSTGTPLLSMEPSSSGDCAAVVTIETRTCGGKSVNTVLQSLAATFPKIVVKAVRQYPVKKSRKR